MWVWRVSICSNVAKEVRDSFHRVMHPSLKMNSKAKVNTNANATESWRWKMLYTGWNVAGHWSAKGIALLTAAAVKSAAFLVKDNPGEWLNNTCPQWINLISITTRLMWHYWKNIKNSSACNWGTTDSKSLQRHLIFITNNNNFCHKKLQNTVV